jgi:HAD superfamily hydrolase (TIGR01450 family)
LEAVVEIEKSFTKWWQKNSSNYGAILFDIDGTLIAGKEALPGAAELLKNLRNSQLPFCLLTNDGNNSTEEKSAIMCRRGLDITPEDIISCGHALSPLAKRRKYRGKKFYIMGELGTPDYAELAGIITERTPSEINSCCGVIVGEGSYNWQENITAVVNYYIKTGNRIMVVPNPDSYWPSGNGEIGIGAGGKARFLCTILKEYGIKIKPDYLGKPYKPVYTCALQMLQQKFNLSRDVSGKKILMLGDSLLSDIRGANRAGFTSGLLLTGISNITHTEKAKQICRPDYIFETLQ